jgi:hypothetical protein
MTIRSSMQWKFLTFHFIMQRSNLTIQCVMQNIVAIFPYHTSEQFDCLLHNAVDSHDYLLHYAVETHDNSLQYVAEIHDFPLHYSANRYDIHSIMQHIFMNICCIMQ